MNQPTPRRDPDSDRGGQPVREDLPDLDRAGGISRDDLPRRQGGAPTRDDGSVERNDRTRDRQLEEPPLP
jgi:hypothetical protein